MIPNSSDQKPEPAPKELRFKPKGRPPKQSQRVAPKLEVTDEAESPEAKELMRRFQESLGGKPKVEKKVGTSRVAFGGAANPSHQYGANMSSYEGKARISSLKDDKEYEEPWNYYSYYPTVLPLRMPYSGDPEVLDEQEFGEVSTYDEGNINLAMELGLMAESSEPRMLFFQLPRGLPISKRATATVDEVSATNSKPSSDVSLTDRPCGFNELKSGFMGKMMVYKSGVVKLKLGETVYDASPGSDCGFGEDVVAVNTNKKHIAVIGELNKHAIITLDVDSILDSETDLGLS